MSLINKNHFLSKHPLATALIIYVIYLAIFYATWAINKVEYASIGKDADSIRLWYAIPTLLASLSTFVFISALGWWKNVLFEKQRGSPAWTPILPIAMLLIIVANFSNTITSNLTNELLLWSILGGIGVGFGEEIITRGSLIVGLRSRFSERKVWLYSTLLFAALHIPNVLFGLDFSKMIVQLVLTFIMGTAFYVMRRISGTLIIPIVLHGLWDSSIFLPQATGSQSLAAVAILIYPLAIICAIPVLKRTRN